jgi:DNA-directed RNA polymerase subunit RPC12/RpoP
MGKKTPSDEKKSTYRIGRIRFGKKNPNQDDSNLFRCAYCDEIITFDQPLPSDTSIQCPYCGHENKFHLKSKTKASTIKENKPAQPKETIEPKEKEPSEKESNKNKIKKILSDNIIELVLIGIGLSYLIDPTINNIKISFTLILIATFLLFLMTGEDETTRYSQKKYSTTDPFFKRKPHVHPFKRNLRSITERLQAIPLTNRIGIVLILWTLLLFIITADIEIYFILIFIGILITRELTDLYTSDYFKKRLNTYIILFLFTYIFLIGQKIIEIIST